MAKFLAGFATACILMIGVASFNAPVTVPVHYDYSDHGDFYDYGDVGYDYADTIDI